MPLIRYLLYFASGAHQESALGVFFGKMPRRKMYLLVRTSYHRAVCMVMVPFLPPKTTVRVRVRYVRVYRYCRLRPSTSLSLFWGAPICNVMMSHGIIMVTARQLTPDNLAGHRHVLNFNESLHLLFLYKSNKYCPPRSQLL
jgi:hypothetical protein